MKRIFSKKGHTFLQEKSIFVYQKSMGVKIGENCEIYKDVLFGSEPYLVRK